MVRRLKFYKEESGEWYVDLPEWEGEKADLQMVAGADTMLDVLSQFEDSIWLTMSTEEQPNLTWKATLTEAELEDEIPSGSVYIVQTPYIKDLPIWLCDVTKFVFGDFPTKIYLY